MTQSGIESATFKLVAQCLTACPANDIDKRPQNQKTSYGLPCLCGRSLRIIREACERELRKQLPAEYIVISQYNAVSKTQMCRTL
jgi:hypothetical protein